VSIRVEASNRVKAPHSLAVLCDVSGNAVEAEALWAEARAALAAGNNNTKSAATKAPQD
jgi:hypothetical protein